MGDSVCQFHLIAALVASGVNEQTTAYAVGRLIDCRCASACVHECARFCRCSLHVALCVILECSN